MITHTRSMKGGLLLLMALVLSFSAKAQSYSSYVGGEPIYLPNPTVTAGYELIWAQYSYTSGSELYVVNNKVTINEYFVGTKNVECYYECTRQYVVAGHMYQDTKHPTTYFGIKCNPVNTTGLPTQLTMQVGENKTVNWSYSPSFVSRPKLTWTSSDYTIVDVSDGKLMARKRGSVLITVKSNAGPTEYINVIVEGDEPNPKLVLSASPSGGEVSSGTTLTLTAKADGSTVSGCDIYYTLNGDKPTKNSTPYTSSGITINSDCTLKAIAYKSGYEASEVLTATYTIKPTPKQKLTLSASPSGGQVSKGSIVTLTAKADGSIISGCDVYYTLNGTTPTKNSTKYTSSGITINSNCTLKAIAYKSGYEDSEVLTTTYAIKETPKPKLILSASPSGGQVSKGSIVTLTAKADGSIISGCDVYYTLNGNTPTKNSTKYTSSGITINSAYTLKAIAYKDGYETSDVLTEPYTIKDKTKLVVVASPSGGEVTKGTNVKLFVRDKNGNDLPGDIYYTLDGSTPSKSSTKYTSSGITINSDCTLKAIAYKDGYETSDVLTESYTMQNTQKVNPTSIRINCSSVSMKTTDTFELYYSYEYPKNTPYSSQAKPSVTWTSNNNSVVTISELYPSTVELTAKSIGTAIITVKSTTGLSAICEVKVISQPELAKLDVKQISCGGDHSMVLLTDGTLWACGGNYHGQLGDGTTTDCNSLKQVMNDVASVSAGGNHTMILKTDGTLWACGSNSSGQLGDGTMEKCSTPKQIMSNVASVSAGGNHTMILKTDGTLWACGSNYNGQLGDNGPTTEKCSTPKLVMTGVASVSAGGSHTMILKTDGTLWACGDPNHGQLGDGSKGWTYSGTPKQVMTNVIAVSAGSEYTMILKTDGTLWACGENDCGQLGDGTKEDCSTPKPVMTDVVFVSAGGFDWWDSSHTMIVKKDGSLWACGSNYNGMFGDGTTEYSCTPVFVMAGVETVSAGGEHSLIKKTNGSLWSCGFNLYGQLGDGTNVDRHTPVQIAGNGIKVTSIKLDKTSLSLHINQEETIIADVMPDNATDKTVSWVSGNTNVATVDSNGKVKAISVGRTTITCRANDGSDVVATCSLTILEKLTLTASPGSGEIDKNTKVTLTAKANGSTVYGCDIYYTLNGSTPTKSSAKYTSSGITINNDCTLKAIAYMDGYETSDELTMTYTVKPDPKLVLFASPSSGQLSKNSTVTLTAKADGSTVSGCDIYYTKDGSTPSKSSTKYTSSGITINEACTLKAIAYKDGYETSDVLTEIYTIKYDDLRLSIASSGYATFYSSESAYKLSNGLSAKVVKAAGNGKLSYETIIIIDGSNTNIVPKGVPVMIESNAKQAGTYTLTATESGATYTGTNLLQGSDEATTTTGDGYHYKLSYGPTGTKWDDVLGWYWGAQNGAPFQIDGHKAWLVVPRSGTRAAGFTIEGESLDIEDIDQTPLTTDCYYDLQGRRLTGMQNVRPSKKGVYIRNGQKVVVK